MGKITGFLEYERQLPERRPVAERVRDWDEMEARATLEVLQEQGARCMNCGVPFCHQGCPLGNVIPDWNDLVYRDRFRAAIGELHRTNNFPEFTGRICPAPCEASCVLSINSNPVTIKRIESEIVDRAWDEGWIVPQRPEHGSGKTVAVVGSGPAGLACAQQLARAGHGVTVYERADRVGGLLRYGIPDFKLDKFQIDRRLAQMESEGVHFRTGVEIGRDLSIDTLREEHDAIVLAVGSTIARDLPLPGRELSGVHLAMDFLTQQNKINAGDHVDNQILATGKRVVVLGGGDTGSDCVGTSLRQGAASVLQIELLDRPPTDRSPETPWPAWPMVLRTSTSQEEGGERRWSILTKRFEGKDGQLEKLCAVEVTWERDETGRMKLSEVAGSEFEIEADLCFLALGFVGPESSSLIAGLGISSDARGNIEAPEENGYETALEGIFACGDARRGQSLVVWAIAEGRQAALGVDRYLTIGARESQSVAPPAP